MDFRYIIKRFGPGVLIVAACVAAVGVARRDRVIAQNDAGLQARAKGDPGAKLLLVEYSDFQCPNCRYAKQAIEELLQQYGSKVRFVFRYYPLNIHDKAMPAATSAECAAKQDKFWAYHDLLFEKREEWSAAPDDGAIFDRYADSLKLDMKAFRECAISPLTRDSVERDVVEGKAWEVDSTPTLFIGHRRLIGTRQIKLYGAGLIEKELGR